MVRVATGAIDELHGKRTVLFAKRRRSSRVKRVWRKAVAQRQRALNGAGEGNRTLVFSLEVAKFRRATKRRSDNLQRSERLKSLRNFFLSEWLRTRSPSVHRPFAPKAPSRRCYRSKIFMRHSSGVRCAWRPPRTVAVRFEEALDRQRRFGIRRAHHVRRGSHVLPTWLQLKPRKPANSNFVKQRPT
jgi:hypothetical protein